jgi:hypothetical protein
MVIGKIKFLYFCLAISATVVFIGCDQEMENLVEEELIEDIGSFSVLSDFMASQSTADFANGEKVFFNAEFNKNVSWIIEITGSETGSIKRIEGFSKTLDATNTSWNGGTTELPLFREERVNAVLLIPEMPDFLETATIEVLSEKEFAGILFTDFEEDMEMDLILRDYEFELTPETGLQTDFPLEGDFYYQLEGTDEVVENFFVGLIEIKSSVTGSNILELPTTIPEDLFFNFFLLSDGGPHGEAIVQFIVDTNDSGAFEGDPASGDRSFRVAINYDLSNFNGWKQISHPMSDTGMTQEELEKIVAIRLILISDLDSQPSPPLPVNFGVDFLSFTVDGPLDFN